MKLTKEDFMRLPKERLAELLVELNDSAKIEFIPVPSTTPSVPFGPTITYTTSDSTNEIKNE